MSRSNDPIIGFLLAQPLWASLAITTGQSSNQSMRWTVPTTFENSFTTDRIILSVATNIGDVQSLVRSHSSFPPTGTVCAANVKKSSETSLPQDRATTQGIDFGKDPVETFTLDAHLVLLADLLMANPPFNIKKWWVGELASDTRWKRNEVESVSHSQLSQSQDKSSMPQVSSETIKPSLTRNTAKKR